MPDLFSFTHAHTYANVSVCVCPYDACLWYSPWADCILTWLGFESNNHSAHEGAVREKPYGEQRDCITCTL